jgi:hypothetical protein
MDNSENFSKLERGSERSFGILFAFVFLIIALYPLINAGSLNLLTLLISIIFFLLAFFKPKMLTFLNILWFKFGLFLGGIIAPIVMFIIYCLAVVPTGLLMRLFNKDLLSTKKNKKVKSYWIKREKPIGSMKNQF